ncbi:MAG TPA: S9 family peptidase [Bacteroidales bacterium]|nr:S9 family peptidase [Bacteroidales bacterium]HBZ65914.1 S9 family peptidase [Bacteroidales bacterium]
MSNFLHHRYYLAIFFFVQVFQLQVISQTILLTPADAAYQNPAIYAKGLQNLQWVPGEQAFSWIANQSLLKQKASSLIPDTVLRLDKLNVALTKLSIKQTNKFPSIEWISNNLLTFTRENKIISFDLLKSVASIINTIPDKAENTDVEPLTKKVAFTRDNNLYLSVETKEIPITDEKNSDIVYGANNVHRNEFGIDKGTFWSPKGNFLAFYRMDQTMVPDYPIVDITTRIATEKPVKYPMAGENMHEVTLGIYNLSSNQTIYMKTGEPAAQYLTSVTWDPSEKFIYIGLLNRDQNHLRLNKYDALTGELVMTLFEEKSEKYVEPENQLYFIPSKANEFLWLSERDGFNHLYHYNTDGKLLGQVTSGSWMITSVAGFDPKGEQVFFLATKESPLQKNIYTADINKGTIRRLSADHGTHTVKLSDDSRYIIDQFNSTDVPLKILITDVKSGKSKMLLEAANPLATYKLGETTLFTLKNDEGTDLWCRMIKPADFDPAKKYPVIIYVYGGPHLQLITDSWLYGAGIYLNYLAQQGYVIFSLDNRGSANRGFAFESAIHRQCGTLEMKDQLTGVNFLKQQPFVDVTRIGVDGWSYGGFMTVNMLLENPGLFKAAVAGGPVCDWKYYEVMYGERYMDTPQTNADGYKKASLIEKAGNLKDRLMIIHCTSDPVVVWQNSLSFVQTCIEKDILLDYFVYPGHDHNVSGPDRTHLIMKIEDYFKKNL